MKKKIPKLVDELRMKLDGLPQVSHTTVIKAKENHLASKALKADLHKLANRRLGRAQDVATERVIGIVSLWAKRKYRNILVIFLRFCVSQESNNHFLNTTDEESVAMEEVKARGKAVQEVELSLQASDVDRNFDGIISNIDKDGKETKKAPEEENKPSIGANRTLMI